MTTVSGDDICFVAGEAFFEASLANDTNALAVARSQHEIDPSNAPSLQKIWARVLNSRISLTRIRNARLAQRVDLHFALGSSFIE